MNLRVKSLLKFQMLLPAWTNLSSPKFLIFMPTTYSTLCLREEQTIEQDTIDQPEDSVQVLKKLGCSDTGIAKIFNRCSYLKTADTNQLQQQLKLLSGLGITAPELAKIVLHRPRFLVSPKKYSFDELLECYISLFGSRELLVKAIRRNPSFLAYDFRIIKATIELYERLGVSVKDLVQLLVSRPTLIQRTSFCEEKMELVRKIGVSSDSKMYKHVVTIIGISRLATIREKIANLEKFGCSEDEVLGLFGRAPTVFTLSIDKVQRNMIFILGHMKLPTTKVLHHPYLLFLNLENVLKPRFLVAEKMREMGLKLQMKGPKIVAAMRKNERRFLEACARRQPKDVVDELMEYYKNVKGVRRLAEASKKNLHCGFPF